MNEMNLQMSDDDYIQQWKKTGPIRIKMIEKTGKCKWDVGQEFIYETPYKPPREACFALVSVMNLYVWRVAQGFPSWEKDDRNIYRIHCPSKKGTVWEMKKV